jgi:hypothetical protein
MTILAPTGAPPKRHLNAASDVAGDFRPREPAPEPRAPSLRIVRLGKNLYAGGAPAGVLHVAGSSDASQSHHLAKVEELVRMLEDQLGSDVPPPSPCVVPSLSRVPMSAWRSSCGCWRTSSDQTSLPRCSPWSRRCLACRCPRRWRSVCCQLSVVGANESGDDWDEAELSRPSGVAESFERPHVFTDN